MSTGIQLSYYKKQVLYLQYVIGEQIRLLCTSKSSDANWTFRIGLKVVEGHFFFVVVVLNPLQISCWLLTWLLP